MLAKIKRENDGIQTNNLRGSTKLQTSTRNLALRALRIILRVCKNFCEKKAFRGAITISLADPWKVSEINKPRSFRTA